MSYGKIVAVTLTVLLFAGPKERVMADENDGSAVASALASKVDDSCCARRLATAQ
jgi:hypothetical protein